MRFRRILFTVVALLVLLALTALPGQATFAKKYTLNIGTPSPPAIATSGTQDQPFKIEYQGKSLFKAGSSNLTLPPGFTDLKKVSYAGPSGSTATVTPATPDGGTTLELRNLKLGLGVKATINVTADVPFLTCGSAPVTYPWLVQTKSSSDFTGSSDFALTSPYSITTKVVAPACAPVTVNVTKYEDLNGNGSRDGEPGLSGWQFKEGSTNVGLPTGESGQTSFTVSPNVDHTICETLPSGWVNTQGPACQTITAAAAVPGATISLVYGNARSATIQVTKFNDSDLDGVFDDGESVLSDPVFSFSLDGGDPVPATDGTVTFQVAAGSGSHTVCEVPQDGWTNTTPGGEGCIEVPANQVTSGAVIPLEFGNAQGSLGCDPGNSQMEVTGSDPQTDLSGVRIENVSTDCVVIAYQFSPNDFFSGGFLFIKDLDTQPDAQFLITQSVTLDIQSEAEIAALVADNEIFANTINGYTTEISYDPDPSNGDAYEPVPVCPTVYRDGDGNVIGAELPTGMESGYCIADQDPEYGAPVPGKLILTTTLFGLGDPATRTRPGTT
jgi:hypothetical protein